MILNKWFLITIVALAAFGGATYEVVDRRAKLSDLRQGEERLSLAVDTLGAAVARFESIPSLVAETRIVTNLLAGPAAPERLQAANDFLETSARDLGLSALYVLDAEGVAVAASNWREVGSFVGHDYSFRPYFIDAMARGAGRYYGVGVTTGQPGLFLSAAVRDDSRTLGAVIVKVDFTPLEQSWASGGERIYVADEDEVVILTSVARSRYRAVRPIPLARLSLLAREQRYAGEPFGAPLSPPGEDRMRLQSAPVPGTGWRLLVESADVARRWQAPAMAAIAVLVPLVSGLGVISWRQRSARLEAERRDLAELESCVATRTADLQEALRKLACEIEERQKIDSELQRTRDELVVAARLAAVGRTFSGLAHEVAQPLAALKTHLHSTRLLIERQEPAAAMAHISLMLEAVDRLATLTGDLKRLAYRGQDERRLTELGEIARRVAELLRFRFSDAGIAFEAQIEGPAIVMGSASRLEQVLLNLLLNAMDAVADQAVRRVRVEIRRAGAGVELIVCDNGPGVSDSDRQRLFEPFFTTKPEGIGLGLGLSVTRAIVEDHGGRLDFLRTGGQESRFIVTLPSVKSEG